jgi:WD40 repeat protein
MAGLWDLATGSKLDSGSILALNSIPHNNVRNVFFSKDGSRMGIFLSDATLKILDVASGSQVQSIQLTTASGSLLFSPDGKYLALAENNWNSYTVQLWDVASGTKLYDLDGHKKDINLLAFSPDGKILISSALDPDKNFIVWDVASGRKINTLPRADFVEPDSIDISPDGKTLAFDHNFGGVFSIVLWQLP